MNDGTRTTRSVRPDPKPAPRIVDPSVTKQAVLRWRECCACGDRAATGHHVMPKSERGDDVLANIVALCGHGTAGCHGAVHGNPYVYVGYDLRAGSLPYEERRDGEWVRTRIGRHIANERADTIDYLVGKLGSVEALDYLRRRYYVEGTP